MPQTEPLPEIIYPDREYIAYHTKENIDKIIEPSYQHRYRFATRQYTIINQRLFIENQPYSNTDVQNLYILQHYKRNGRYTDETFAILKGLTKIHKVNAGIFQDFEVQYNQEEGVWLECQENTP